MRLWMMRKGISAVKCFFLEDAGLFSGNLCKPWKHLTWHSCFICVLCVVCGCEVRISKQLVLWISDADKWCFLLVIYCCCIEWISRGLFFSSEATFCFTKTHLLRVRLCQNSPNSGKQQVFRKGFMTVSGVSNILCCDVIANMEIMIWKCIPCYLFGIDVMLRLALYFGRGFLLLKAGLHLLALRLR